MSTLVVSNISDGTTTVGASYVTNGSAKAWVNFNGQGTIAVRNSLNLSSLTDNGVGDFTINLSSGFSSTGYTCSAFFGQDGATGTGRVSSTNASPTASSFRFTDMLASDGSSHYDDAVSMFTMTGDLA